MNDLLIFASLYYGPKHGYLIKKEAGLILGGGELHNNLVYPLLHRFERRGWVGKKKSGGERGQTRLEYFLTPAGKAEMIRRLEGYSGLEASDDAFYLRAGLFDLLPAAARQRILSARQRQLEEMSARLERISAELSPPGSAARVLSFLERKTRFELDWVRALAAVVSHRCAPLRGKPGRRDAPRKRARL
jgi:DNA-binding PadR family transcriptional regulator